ncbi:MAG: translocation/assembly module TamB domain-containing protein [Candidatus Krumholzibacteriota bacterium]|nr:translocation/assembly module TamB domain-containing protein [Candidatus Krumholzibacteriota bacterium]
MVKRILKSKITSWISLIIGLLLTVVILVAVIYNTDFFAHRASSLVSRNLFRGTDFSLEFKSISGNPLDRIRIKDLRIRYMGEDYAFDVLRVEEIVFSYQVGSLVSNEPLINELVFVKPHVWAKPDSAGVLILPFVGGGSGGGGGKYKVEKFSISDGQLIYQGAKRADAVRALNLEGMIRSDGEKIVIEVSKGSTKDIRRKIEIKKIQGRVQVNSDRHPGRADNKRISIENLFVELEESSLLINGTVDPDSIRFDLNIAAEPFEIEEMMRVLDIKSEQFGELQGALAVKGVPGEMEIRGMLNGILSGYALDGFKVDIDFKKGEFVRLNKGEGRFNGALINGSGILPLSGNRIIQLDLDVRDLDLSTGFIKNNSIPESRFNGFIGLRYEIETKDLYFTMDLDKGHLRRIPFNTATASGSYRSDSLFIDKFVVSAPKHTVETRGSISRKGDIKLFIDMTCAKGDTFFSYFNIEEYDADVAFNGILEGDFDRWDLRASGSCRDLLYKGAYLPFGEINFALNKSDSFRLFMDMRGDSCDIDRFSFSGIELSLEHYKDVTSIKKLHIQRPGFAADMRGDLHTEQDKTEIVFNEVTIDALEERWVSNGKFSVNVIESKIRFDDLQLHSRLGALFMDCEIDEDKNEIDGLFSFERLGISLLNKAGLTKIPMRGRGAGQIICKGSRDNPRLKLDLVLDSSVFDSIAVDSLRLVAEYSDNVIGIDTFYLDSPEGVLEMTGTISGTNPGDISREKAGAFKDALIQLDAVCKELSLVPLFSSADKMPFVKGDFTGLISVRDSLSHPLLGIEGKIEGLASERYQIPLIDFSADINRDLLSLDGVVEVSSGHTGDFTGNIPLRSEKWFYSIDKDSQMNLGISFPDGDMSSVPGMTDIVAEANGRFSAEFAVTGTLSDPKMKGQLLLDKAGFRLGGMEEKFREIEAEIILDDTLVTVRKLRGKEGKNGNLNCKGTILLKGWKPEKYDLKIELSKILVASIPDVMSIVSGNLSVGTTESGGNKIPVITGNLIVNGAEIYIDFGDFNSAQKGVSLEPPNWIAEVDLVLKGNTWLKTPDANVEIEGDITLHHDQKGSYIRGTLNLIRGWYNVYNNKFRVVSGKLEFVHAESFRPILDVEAETNDPEGRKIYLTLSWHQDDNEPRVYLRHEDPGYSETDIWKMLGGGMAGTENGDGMSWSAMNTAQNLAANYIERMLNSQMQGVLIEVETSGGSSSASEGFEPTETTVAIGKYMSEGLYVKYKQGLSISTARHFEVEYRLSRLFLIRSEVIMYSEKILQGRSRRNSDEINVDFKVRWEF